MGGFKWAGGGAQAAHVVGSSSDCDILARAAHTHVRCNQHGTMIPIADAQEMLRQALVHLALVHQAPVWQAMSALAMPGCARNNNNHQYQ
jgi:hypothetical protein